MSLQVSVDEGHALEVLDMLCRGRAIRIVPAQPVAQPRPELTELAARRIAATSLRVLTTSGRRERVVLRDGRRVRGRIWDAARSAGFRLRFTAATFELWVQATQRLAGIARAAEVVEGEGSSRRARRQIRKIIKIAETDTGDWLVYALAYRHIARAAMPQEIREELGRRLCLGSPLATLFALEDPLAETDLNLAAHLDRLLAGPAVALLECLEEMWVEQWVEQLTSCMRSTPGELRAARLHAAAAVLETFCDRLDRHGRLDLCRAVAESFDRLLAEAWAGAPEEVVARVLFGAGLVARAQKDALQRALARILLLGERLQGYREQMARESFGDPRYEESQLYLEMYDALLRPHERRLRALVNTLTGRLG